MLPGMFGIYPALFRSIQRKGSTEPTSRSYICCGGWEKYLNDSLLGQFGATKEGFLHGFEKNAPKLSKYHRSTYPESPMQFLVGDKEIVWDLGLGRFGLAA